MSKKEDFDYAAFEAEALKQLQSGGKLEGRDGVLAPLLKRLLEASLSGELDSHLSEEKSKGNSNRRNGRTRKTVKTSFGPIEVEQSRDRSGSFEPELIGKRERVLGTALETKILSLYANGSSYSDIQSHIEELYGLEVSAGKITGITDKIWPEVEEWRNRPLEPLYPVLWLDAMYFKVRINGRVVTRCIYTVLGVNVLGMKEVLGFYVGKSEGAKFWLQVLTDLQHRGVEDVLIACIDNLKGFAEAIETVFPQARVQLCIVHQIRNTKRYLTTEDTKPFMVDLKQVYQASSRESAEHYLDELDAKWAEKYPIVIKSWRRNWDRLAEHFDYPTPIRKMIYTTNVIEGYHRHVRKMTKTKGAFTNDKALMKLVFLAQEKVAKKWTKPVHKWALIVSQLSMIFEERINPYLKI